LHPGLFRRCFRYGFVPGDVNVVVYLIGLWLASGRNGHFNVPVLKKCSLGILGMFAPKSIDPTMIAAMPTCWLLMLHRLIHHLQLICVALLTIFSHVHLLICEIGDRLCSWMTGCCAESTRRLAMRRRWWCRRSPTTSRTSRAPSTRPRTRRCRAPLA
jgi:hypothetical protein